MSVESIAVARRWFEEGWQRSNIPEIIRGLAQSTS